MEHLRPKGQGIVPKGSKIEIRWNSKVGVNQLPSFLCSLGELVTGHGASCKS